MTDHTGGLLRRPGASVLESAWWIDHYERPVVEALLGEVDGRRLLDAATGDGARAERLAARGARVTAVDRHPAMVTLARHRLGDDAEVRAHDLQRPLDFAADGSFDAVHSSLTLHYLSDWDPVLAELHRVLRPGGVLVVSTLHPLADPAAATDWFATGMVEAPWRTSGAPRWRWLAERALLEGIAALRRRRLPRLAPLRAEPVIARYHRRTFEGSLRPLLRAGFVLDEVVEPRPDAVMRRRAPAVAERLDRTPLALVMRAHRP